MYVNNVITVLETESLPGAGSPGGGRWSQKAFLEPRQNRRRKLSGEYSNSNARVQRRFYGGHDQMHGHGKWKLHARIRFSVRSPEQLFPQLTVFITAIHTRWNTGEHTLFLRVNSLHLGNFPNLSNRCRNRWTAIVSFTFLSLLNMTTNS